MAFERWDFLPLVFKGAPSGITMPRPECPDRRLFGRVPETEGNMGEEGRMDTGEVKPRGMRWI
jgi:hypothetical protein